MLSWRGETPAFRVPVPFLLPWFPWPLWHHFWFVRLCFITDAPGHLFRPPCRFMEIGSGGWDCTRTTHADGAKGIKPFVLLGSSLFLEYTESSSSILSHILHSSNYRTRDAHRPLRVIITLDRLKSTVLSCDQVRTDCRFMRAGNIGLRSSYAGRVLAAPSPRSSIFLYQERDGRPLRGLGALTARVRERACL